ncbi:MAG: hypothetical protein M0002_05325 [Rhodospirillales bacterium]|nr:hypothetical protein [Rhodospirillales bacterium]
MAEAFDVPPALEAQGSPGQVLTRRLHDQLVHIREHTVITVEKRVVANLLTWSYIGLRDHATARGYAQQIIEERPRYYGRWARLGQIQLAAREYDAAVENLKRALPAGTRAVGVRALVARSLYGAEGPGAAFAFIWDCISRNSKDSPLFVAWRDILLAEGDGAAALGKIRHAADLSRTLPHAFESWGRALAPTGDAAGALVQLEQGIRFGPRRAAPRLTWGDALATRGDFAGAIARYETAITLDPRWAEPYTR